MIILILITIWIFVILFIVINVTIKILIISNNIITRDIVGVRNVQNYVWLYTNKLKIVLYIYKKNTQIICILVICFWTNAYWRKVIKVSHMEIWQISVLFNIYIFNKFFLIFKLIKKKTKHCKYEVACVFQGKIYFVYTSDRIWNNNNLKKKVSLKDIIIIVYFCDSKNRYVKKTSWSLIQTIILFS